MTLPAESQMSLKFKGLSERCSVWKDNSQVQSLLYITVSMAFIPIFSSIIEDNSFSSLHDFRL